MSRFGDRANRRKLAKGLLANRSAEERYVRDLKSIVRGIHKAYMNFLEPRLSSMAGKKDSHFRHTVDLDALDVEIATQIPKHVQLAFRGMADQVNKSNRTANQKLLGVTSGETGASLAIDAARDKSIRLVEDAARAYAKQVREVFEDPENVGRRVEELRDALLERGNVSESRAELIARDQTMKLNGAMTEARQRGAGVDRYTWSTSKDERVREEHAALEGETFSWDDAPEPGHPGEDYQCRCVALPVVDELEGI